MIALRSGAAVVPVAIIGNYKLFRKTRIVYGPPSICRICWSRREATF